MARAPPTPKIVVDPDAPKAMTPHNLEHIIADDESHMKGAFWNPLEVSELAWNHLLRKLSAVAAIEVAKKRTRIDDDSSQDDDGKKSKHSAADSPSSSYDEYNLKEKTYGSDIAAADYEIDSDVSEVY
jgi:hypothetical protein